MSLIKSATRRLSLLAGSSLIAAGLSAAAGLGLTLTPGQATAQSCSSLATGAATVTIPEDGCLVVGTEMTGTANIGVLEQPTIINFTASNATLVNEGLIVVGPRASSNATLVREHEAELRLTGLTEFRHSGKIVLGGRGISLGDILEGTDTWHDDILVLDGGTWVGDGGEVVFDVDPNLTQSSCARVPQNTSDPASGDLAAADCLRIVDGATEGVTYITLTETFPGDRASYNPDGIVLVETPGSTSAQGHFVVGPNTPGWSPLFGGSLDKGLFQYVIAYDEDREQHILYGVMSGSSYQFPMLATAAHSLWRTSTGTWLERQADLRGGVEDGVGGGVWLRAATEQADREVTSVSAAGGTDFAFDNSQEQKTYAVTGGIDLVSGMEGDTAYVLGLMAGYAHADIAYAASPNEQAMDGWTGGVYASFISGGLYVDAAINANNIILDNDTPGFNFFPADTILSSRLTSVGGQVEAGWRIPLEGGVFVEPLAGLSYVRSRYDDIVIRPDDPNRPGLEVSYDDPASLRAGVGGRVGVERDFGTMRTQLSLLGRVWNEFEGESAISVHNLAFPTEPDVALTDDFSGRISEIALGASVYSPGGAVSAHLNLGGRFGDDYEATTASAGVRVAF